MHNILNLLPEDVNTIEKRRQHIVSVVGCRKKGILYAIEFAKAGYSVICIDSDQSLIKRLAEGKALLLEREIQINLKRFLKNGQLSTSNEIRKSVSESGIIIITITPKIDAKKLPDYSEVENSCKQIGSALRQGALVIFGGTPSLGFTEGILKETLENTSGLKVGEDFGLAYTLAQTLKGEANELSNQDLMVAADNKASLEAASTILGTLTTRAIKQVSNARVAEIATLFNAARRDVNIALANELAILCEKGSLDYFEISKLLVPDTLASFSPTIESEAGEKEIYFLLENAESLNTKLRLATLARQINEGMIKHVVSLVQSVLRSCGKTLRRARVALEGTLGSDSAAETLVKLLEAKGATIKVYDPLFAKSSISEVPHLFKRTINEGVEGTDCVVILSENNQFRRLNLKKMRNIMKMPAGFVDLTGDIQPKKVEKVGFIYRGLGRGAEKK